MIHIYRLKLDHHFKIITVCSCCGHFLSLSPVLSTIDIAPAVSSLSFADCPHCTGGIRSFRSCYIYWHEANIFIHPDCFICGLDELKSREQYAERIHCNCFFNDFSRTISSLEHTRLPYRCTDCGFLFWDTLFDNDFVSRYEDLYQSQETVFKTIVYSVDLLSGRINPFNIGVGSLNHDTNYYHNVMPNDRHLR